MHLGLEVFKGIPYAAPPVGELRWKAPKPVQTWNGVRSSDEWGRVLHPQIDFGQEHADDQSTS